MRNVAVPLLLQGELVQSPAAAARTRRRETDEILVAVRKSNVESRAFQDTEELAAMRAMPFMSHQACPPSVARK